MDSSSVSKPSVGILLVLMLVDLSQQLEHIDPYQAQMNFHPLVEMGQELHIL